MALLDIVWAATIVRALSVMVGATDGGDDGEVVDKDSETTTDEAVDMDSETAGTQHSDENIAWSKGQS